MSSSPDLRHNLKRISPYTVELGEGPHYDEKTGRLYHVDLVKGGCYYLDTKTLEYESIYFEPGLTLIVPIEGKPGHFVISKNRSLYSLDWANKNCCDLITTVDEGKDTRVNDGKCDPSGRLWFGTMNWERKPGIFADGLGSLYSLDHNKQVSLHQDNITISNGLAWSSDKTKFYFIDSMARQVWVYDYDDNSGNICNRRTIFDYKDHSDFICREVPDGMTIDLHDKIWVTSFNGKKVTRIDPETGKILGIIKTPASKTTSATWGGPDFRTLYVTSATFGASQEELQAESDAGAIFSVTFEQENIRGSINQEVKLHS